MAATVCLVVMLFFGARPAESRQANSDPGYWERSTLPQMGLATYYDQGMMEYVVNYRQGHGQLPRCADCVGAVALLRAGDIGRKVWLQLPGSNEVAGPFLVVDCARREDVSMLVDRNWVVDVSYEVGQTWKMTGPLAGVIVWPDPAEGNNPPPPAQPTQFYVDPKAVVLSAPTADRPAAAKSALPTRLPGPRPPSDRIAAALTPVVTTPTPPGTRSAPDTIGSAPSGPSGGPSGSGMDVSLGRPGQELLLLAARPAAFLQSPTPRPQPTTAATTTMVSATFASPAEATTTPVPPGLDGPQTESQPPGKPDLLSRIWRSLLGLLSLHPAK